MIRDYFYDLTVRDLGGEIVSVKIDSRILIKKNSSSNYLMVTITITL